LTENHEEGRITTFYSFKGGVGRSMALANVAFMAAMNNLKVLVMDWDLEAPGLGYYFRGLLEPQEARARKKSGGILDAVWEWTKAVRGADGSDELNEIVDRHIRGGVFDDLIRPLLDGDTQMHGYTLDILGAGSDRIADELSYEDALSRFSWTEFFDADGGGIMLKALRDWAKRRYDVILIDSRTGLADVAGICTMQLPDTVALCFILNRQNMEGVARVAGAIRAKRNEEIKLRAIPMRLASRGTSEEASALARARRELTMYGGFSSDMVDEDVRALSVDASPNVPFYEAIASIMAHDPVKDTLSQNYLQLASELLGRDLQMPVLPDGLADRIRRRLQPRHATPDYLVQLRSSVPERAFEEVTHLIESALDAQLEHDTDLEDDYVEALVRTTFQIGGNADTPFEATVLLGQAIDLVRARMLEHGGTWRPLLIEAISNYLELSGFIESSEQLALLEEIELLLSKDQTIATGLIRLKYRRQAARLHLIHLDIDAAFQTIAELQKLIASLEQHELAPDQNFLLQTASADVLLLRGDAYVMGSSAPERAIHEYLRGSNMVAANERGELGRFRFEFALRLATRLKPPLPPVDRAQFALEAAKVGGAQSYGASYFTELAPALLEQTGENASSLAEFIRFYIGHERQTALITFHARQPRIATRFFAILARSVKALGLYGNGHADDEIEMISRASVAIARIMARRLATLSLRSEGQELVSAVDQLIGALSQNGHLSSIPELEHIKVLSQARLRSRRPDQAYLFGDDD
jgi:MinD-like ATPase involved in chromosome partitioning or flagellar assembly